MRIPLATAIEKKLIENGQEIGYIGDNDQFNCKIYFNSTRNNFQLTVARTQVLYGCVSDYSYYTDNKEIISTRFLQEIGEIKAKMILTTRHLCITSRYEDGSKSDCQWCN